MRIESALTNTRRPTLIIWGAHDRLNLLEDGRRLHAQMVGSQLVVFDDCGHIPQEEMPAAFAREVLSFIKSGANG